MRLLFKLILACYINLYGIESGDSSAIEWTHHHKLRGVGQFEIKWTNADKTWLQMEIRAKTKGYIGVGFSPHGGMIGADIVIGWVDASGVPHLKDHHGVMNGVPTEDPHQDYELISWSEAEGETIISFKRKWDTCDVNDMAIGMDTTRLIWAWSPTDPEEGKPLHYHGFDQRGILSVYMRRGSKLLEFPDDIPSDTTTKHWDITMNNFKVPQVDMLYWCRIYQFPKLDKKNSIIGYRPLISNESFPYIHHVGVYSCKYPEELGKIDDVFGKYVNQDGDDCMSYASPMEWKQYCFYLIMAAGIGSQGEMYPAHIGNPIGSDSATNLYVKLEVHYENPLGHNVQDSSGMRAFYTDKLRKFDLALLTVGSRLTPFHTIPPFQPGFRIFGFCPSDCTKAGLPTGGIKVFNILLHAHSSGKKLVLRHIRDGVELEPIGFDDNYDSNYQQYRQLENEVTILPGDELIMECEYETKNHTKFLLGGISGHEEMCLTVINYYPKASLADCRDQIEYYDYLDTLDVQNATGELLQRLNIPYDPAHLPREMQDRELPDDFYWLMSPKDKDLFSSLTIQKPGNLNGTNLYQYMNDLNWRNATYAKLVEEKWRKAQRYTHCSTENAIRIKIPNHIGKIAEYSKLVSKPSHCEGGS